MYHNRDYTFEYFLLYCIYLSIIRNKKLLLLSLRYYEKTVKISRYSRLKSYYYQYLL